MASFRKAVLSVGTYHSPDGVVVVTAPRLVHWANQVARIQATDYAIPMHWDHAENDSIDLLEPIKLSALKEGKSRSAAHTVGKLVSFKVATDGQSAELTVETLTPSATEKANSNAVYVSPVLFDKWKDGAGNEYTDTIGSIDLVDYPVDHSQGPFMPVASSTRMGCAIRMSATPSKLFRLGPVPMTFPDKSDDGDGDEQKAAPEADAAPTPAPQAPPTSARIADAIKGLAALKIMLPEDTTPENFLDRLVPALMTAAAQTAPDAVEAEQLPPEPPTPEQPVLADNPQIAAMSLRIRTLETNKLNEGRAAIAARLDALVKSGRATPAEFQAKSKTLGVQKLSLSKDDTINAGSIGIWLEARESTPEGSCWSPEMRTQKLSAAVKVAKAPESWNSKIPDIEAQRLQKRQMLRQPTKQI